MICNSCGGVIGVDCFNPTECQWISEQIEQNKLREIEERIKLLENKNKEKQIEQRI